MFLKTTLFCITVPFVFKKWPQLWLFWFIQPLVFLFFLSLGTKNFWYVAPAIPLLSVLYSLSLYFVVERFFKNTKTWFFVFVLILGYPFYKAYEYAFNPTEKYYTWETNGISYYLRDKNHSEHLHQNTQILLDTIYGLEPHLFYLNKLKIERGFWIPRVHHTRVEENDTLLVSHQSVYNYLNQSFKTETLDSCYKSTRLLVLKKK